MCGDFGSRPPVAAVAADRAGPLKLAGVRPPNHVTPGLLLRGFLAVWVLSLGIGILWLWQLFRLWRFRWVPLRESLPSPFGMRLGSGPMAAAWVGSTQFLCAWLPPVFALVVMGKSFHWLTPDTPIWDRFLVVTPWMTDEPVSPWFWDPAKILDGGAYWLKEALQGYEPGTLRIEDKTSFFIFGQPFLMVLSAHPMRCPCH